MVTANKMTREWFRKQGSIGGKKAAKSMTPEQRSERSRKGAAAREAKRKKESAA